MIIELRYSQAIMENTLMNSNKEQINMTRFLSVLYIKGMIPFQVFLFDLEQPYEKIVYRDEMHKIPYKSIDEISGVQSSII
jgi:hypothetical protein